MVRFVFMIKPGAFEREANLLFATDYTNLHDLFDRISTKVIVMEDFIYKEDSYKIIGICMEIHRFIGHGFLEVVYKDAMEIEFKNAPFAYEREKPFNINYKGTILQHQFFADFTALDKIIVEVKASKDGIANDSIAQTLNYLKVSDYKLGLIINFGKSSLEYKRLILKSNEVE